MARARLAVSISANSQRPHAVEVRLGADPEARIVRPAGTDVLADPGGEVAPLGSEHGKGVRQVGHVVSLQALELVPRERRRVEPPAAGPRLEAPRQEPAPPERKVNERFSRLPYRGGDLPVDLVESERPRPADFEDA